MTSERRDPAARGAVFQRILHNILENPAARFTFQRFQELLGVPEAAARRILDRLVAAGVVTEVERGVWARTWSHVHPHRASSGA